MAEQEQDTSSLESFTLPYRPGEFQEVANRLMWLVESLEGQKVTGLVPQEMRSAATALARAEGLLSGQGPAQGGARLGAERVEPEPPASSPAAEARPEGAPAQEVGKRGEWHGWVATQPEFDHVKGGQLRGWFYLAQHPDPADREKTDWARCYGLGRHAEGMQKRFGAIGRAVGAEVVVRGSFQGMRQVTRKDKSVIDEQSVYVYGIRVLRPLKQGAGQ